MRKDLDCFKWAFGHSVSLAARNTASANRPPGFIARRTFSKAATGSLKNMIPKRENASVEAVGCALDFRAHLRVHCLAGEEALTFICEERCSRRLMRR
jgi:hypothetical protein